jgi:hypothetical protein
MGKSMTKLLTGFLIFLVAALAHAQTSKRASVEELLELSGVEAMVEAQYSQLDQLLVGVGEQLGVKESERESFDKFMIGVVESMKSGMSWERKKEPMIDIYLESYSEEEIQGLLAFYRSDVGQSLMRKSPEVMDKSARLTQEMFNEFMPAFKERIEQFRSELKASRAAE